MKNLTPELIAKAKAANSADELFEIAKANNLEITAEEANTYFEQLNANGEVSDDALDAVAGGGIFGCGDDEDKEEEKKEDNNPNPVYKKCGYCGNVFRSQGCRCPVCMRYLSQDYS